MNSNLRSTCCTVGVFALIAASAAAKSERVAVELEARARRNWDVWLPREHFSEIGAGVALPHRGGERFALQLEGDRLRADLDGNGEFEALVEGDDGFLTFTGTSPEGHAIDYSVRLQRRQGGPWQYSCGTTMVGHLGDTELQFIDQNLNGSFNDIGEDALVVGRDGVASLLSSVVSIGGTLYSLDVARDGSRMEFEPYTGPAGTLDLLGSFDCKAKLRAAVVVSADGRNSYSLARAKGGLAVPAGDYHLLGGEIVLGDAHAQFRGSSDKSFAVESGRKVAPAWGGPVRAEFLYQRRGDEVGFTPWDIWYYGRLGEEYSNFLPLGKSPDFVIVEAKTGEPLVIARFPGNC